MDVMTSAGFFLLLNVNWTADVCVFMLNVESPKGVRVGFLRAENMSSEGHTYKVF